MDIFSDLADRWPSALVARREVEKFSGGMLRARTMANRDSAGSGPPKVKIGRVVAYPVTDLIAWMRAQQQGGHK